MAFHPHVDEVRQYFSVHYPNDEKADVARKLTVPTEKVDAKTLEKMWASVQQAEINKYNKLELSPELALDDDLWVHVFIGAAHESSNFPPYFYLSKADRAGLISDIQRLTNQLSGILCRHQLDYQLVHIDGKLFNGFYIYEGFGEKNRYLIDQAGDQKLKFSEVLKAIATEATEEISYAHTNAKAGQNVQEIRFIRSLAERNIHSYGTPLHAVIATATLAIYGSKEYTESDIANLLNRGIKKETREQVLSRLAAMKKSDYERVRGAEASKLGLHPSTLDDEVGR